MNTIIDTLRSEGNRFLAIWCVLYSWLDRMLDALVGNGVAGSVRIPDACKKVQALSLRCITIHIYSELLLIGRRCGSITTDHGVSNTDMGQV